MSTGGDAHHPAGGSLGRPRVHLRLTDSTNRRARDLALRGAPHGTVVTADEQSAGRGRQGRSWVAPAGRALLCSILLREPPPLLPLLAGVAVAETVGAQAALKWPNDVLLEGRKVAGMLVEGRPQERWAVVGVGVNVAVEPSSLPAELRTTAGTLALVPEAIEPTLTSLLHSLGGWLGRPSTAVLEEARRRDALRGQQIAWGGGAGMAAGIDDEGRLLVDAPGGRVVLEAGEVHLAPSGGMLGA